MTYFELTAIAGEPVEYGRKLAPKHVENRMEEKSFVYRALGTGGMKVGEI